MTDSADMLEVVVTLPEGPSRGVAQQLWSDFQDEVFALCQQPKYAMLEPFIA